jgi:hypothetical protein
MAVTLSSSMMSIRVRIMTEPFPLVSIKPDILLFSPLSVFFKKPVMGTSKNQVFPLFMPTREHPKRNF